MKLTHPISLALLAGGLATITSFLLHAGADDKPVMQDISSYESAIFAGGCFWCVESDFDKVDGVLETISGYTGGTSENPTYETHTKENHLEAVKVIYDPAIVEYEELLDYFLHHIDPTDAGGQFCDRGNSYTTAVFYGTENERVLTEAKFAQIDSANTLPGPIVTAVRSEEDFHPAEAKHQDYYLKNPSRYSFYRTGCGRDARIKQVWGNKGQS